MEPPDLQLSALVEVAMYGVIVESVCAGGRRTKTLFFARVPSVGDDVVLDCEGVERRYRVKSVTHYPSSVASAPDRTKTVAYLLAEGT